MRRVLAAFLTLLSCACASPAPTARVPVPSAPPPPTGALDPLRAPNTTSVFNIAALRSRPRTRPLLALFSRSLPPGVSVDDLEWLGVDGPGGLDEPERNVTFVGRPGVDVLVARGARRISIPSSPTPPTQQELVLVRVHAPARLIRLPFFSPPDSVEYLTLRVEGRDDESVDVHLREHCADPAEATKAAATLDAMVERLARGRASEMTGHLFVGAKAGAEDSDARLDLQANPDQIDALVGLALALGRGP